MMWVSEDGTINTVGEARELPVLDQLSVKKFLSLPKKVREDAGRKLSIYEDEVSDLIFRTYVVCNPDGSRAANPQFEHDKFVDLSIPDSLQIWGERINDEDFAASVMTQIDGVDLRWRHDVADAASTELWDHDTEHNRLLSTFKRFWKGLRN